MIHTVAIWESEDGFVARSVETLLTEKGKSKEDAIANLKQTIISFEKKYGIENYRDKHRDTIIDDDCEIVKLSV